jgi:cysteinyl-tRNA synthetase
VSGLALFNTLTRRVEPFAPLTPPRVTMYMCGPTVWNYAHVGNFRTFLVGDVLRRYLEYAGYQVFLIMNLTDVDDRIIKAAAAEDMAIRDFTERYARAFFEDRDFLRIQPADVYPRATDYIGPMTALVERLLERGLAYRGEDGSVYFAVRAFPTYGRLSRLDTRELKTGARVASDEYAKDEAQDFALWKAAVPADEAVGAAWDAPFGRGRPGWHLECSAMSLAEIRTRFGIETLDIHAGGKDLVFPHHENEIAQSEGATGATFARVWLHGEFLTVHGTKMSKRFGNILTVRDLREEGVDPAAFRLLMFSAHYRQELNYTDDALRGAEEGARRLGLLRDRLLETAAGGTTPGPAPAEAVELEREFRAAMDDDLNTPKGLAALFTFARAANRVLDGSAWRPEEAAAALAALDRVLEVLDVLPTPVGGISSVAAVVGTGSLAISGHRLSVSGGGHVMPADLDAKIAEREAARKAKDFARADAIRDELAARGVELEDTPQGTRWRVRQGPAATGGGGA